MLGLHLAKHGEERRVRNHLNDLLGTPEDLMMIDGEETAKETILVSLSEINNHIYYFLKNISKNSNKIFFPFQGVEKHKILRCILNHLKEVPRWQRIYIEYTQQFKD